MNFCNKSKGYTLIEIIVVIGIMGLLTAIVYSSFDGSKANSRDQKRVSDISNIQLALEQYFNKHGVYPITLDKLVNPITPANPAIEKPYISSIPTVAKTGDVEYSDSYFPMTKTQGSSNCITYQLWTIFERKNMYLDSKKNFNSTNKFSLPNGLFECIGTPQVLRAGINAAANEYLYDVMP